MGDSVRPTVAKRRLTDIDFTQEDSHLALVHKVQGGAANGYSTLITKATGNYSKEFIHKASQVKVTMELPDFLEKFFGVWGDDALLLASMFGYTPSADATTDQSFWSWWREKCTAEGTLDYWGDTPYATEADKQEWVQSRLKGVEILKAASGADNLVEFLAGLKEEDHLTLLQDQEWIEKNFKQLDVVGKQPSPQEDSPQAVQKAVTAKQTTEEGKDMTDKTTDTVEVEKSKEAVALAKALERIEELEKKEAASVAKARLEAVASVLDAEDQVTAVFKAIGELPQEHFDAVVGVLKSQTPLEQKDPMFKEQGSPQEGVQVAKSKVQGGALMDALTEKYGK